MKKQILTVRDVDKDVWREFRARSEHEGLKTGEALSQAIRIWIKEKEEEEAKEAKPNPRLLLKVRPIKVGKLEVRWSEQIDETLYGS